MASCCSTVSSSRAGSGVVGGVDLSSVQNPMGNSLAVQWLGLCAFIAEGVGSIPGRGTKILQATWCSPKKKKKKPHGPTDCFTFPSLRVSMQEPAPHRLLVKLLVTLGWEGLPTVGPWSFRVHSQGSSLPATPTHLGFLLSLFPPVFIAYSLPIPSPPTFIQ